jgi:hypothetical protein
MIERPPNDDLFGPGEPPQPDLSGSGINMTYFNRLVDAFYHAALYLKARVEQDGWHWHSNYLREHVRCATGMQFTNTLSPQILRELRYRHPEFKPYIDIGTLKEDR